MYKQMNKRERKTKTDTFIELDYKKNIDLKTIVCVYDKWNSPSDNLKTAT